MTTDGTRAGGGRDRLDEAAERPGGSRPPATRDERCSRGSPGGRRRKRRGRGALLLLLAVTAIFSASAFLDAGPREERGDRGGRGSGEASREGYVPPGMRCGAGNLCDEGGGARGASVPPTGPQGGTDGR